MRVLLLASAFNGLTQRIHRELTSAKHIVTVELATSAEAMEEAVALFEPHLIVCPFLKQRVPESIWRKHRCLIVHPGIEGDRGPSSLDWAITRGLPTWGVTLLEAAEEMDAGDIWGTRQFPLRKASKGSIYRREVTQAAVELVLEAVEKAQDKKFKPRKLNYQAPHVTGSWNRPIRQEDRQIDWRKHSAETIVTKINAADSAPGVLDLVAGKPVHLFNAWIATGLRGVPGQLIAQAEGAVCRATHDGAVWIGHMRPVVKGETTIKLASMQVLGDAYMTLPLVHVDPLNTASTHRSEIRYREVGQVGYLSFDFYNGAMNTDQSQRLADAIRRVKQRPVKVIVLMGGEEFWSNGIHLNTIEAARDPAAESWRNINAIDDCVLEILNCPDQLTIAALRTNAGAGGAVMAAACDHVFARAGVVMNVHYKTMGLYGSEYWTYVLPRKVGTAVAIELTEQCLPTSVTEAQQLGLVTRVLPEQWDIYHDELEMLCSELAASKDLDRRIAAKKKERARDEAAKPLAAYREEELRHMKSIFFDPHSEYHRARADFVFKRPAMETPPRIAAHRAKRVRRSTAA